MKDMRGHLQKKNSIALPNIDENNQVIANESQIKQSGNSDVDVTVNIEIETISIGYAMLCSLWAKEQLTDQQFERAVQKLEQWGSRRSTHTKIDHSRGGSNSKYKVNESQLNKRNDVFYNKRLFNL